MSIQGKIANLNGRGLEKRVEELIKSYNVTSLMYMEWLNDKFVVDTEYVLLKNVPYITIYGGSGRSEFLLLKNGHSLIDGIRIECRSQQVNGSVDEKLPYLFESALAFRQHNVIIILEGDGFKDGAREWLKARCAAIKYKNIRVLTFEEFKQWLQFNLG